MSERTIASSEIERLEISDVIPDKTIYEPLPAGEFIRVLKLEPGETDQDIECSLEIVDIEQSKDSYEALSYVWGDPNNTVNIRCNGLRVAITVSLAESLRNFRHSSEPRVLWADALCINQNNNQEKGHQVKRMGEVYANAKRTLVWLGCDDQNIAEGAFAAIREAIVYFGVEFLAANQSLLEMEPFTKPYPICMDRQRWVGVARLLNFQWFTRLWTVQEAAIAKECRMFWGPVSINIADALELCSWFTLRTDFHHVIASLVRPVESLSTPNTSLYLYYNSCLPERWQELRIGLAYLFARFNEKTFWTVLRGSRSLEASDPRDHVYAFLGCPAAIDSEGRMLVQADYTSSIDDLSLRLAYSLMKDAAEGPFVLPAIHHDSRHKLLDRTYPSWVPVWHVGGKARPNIAEPIFWFQAGGTRELFTATQHGGNCLAVGACTFDTVVWRSNTIRLDQTGLDLTYASTSGLNGIFIDTLWNDVIQSSSQLGITVRQPDFLRSLIIGYPSDEGPSTISDERQQSSFDIYRKSISAARQSDPEAVVMSPGEKRDARYFKSMLQDLCNASIFLTRDGRIGVAPQGVLIEVGDVCCIIFGATVPFLLTPAREGRHMLISDCYIHGVMNGEIIQQFAESDLSKHHVVLE